MAMTSGAESFAPIVKDVTTMTPNAKSPQIDPKPMTAFLALFMRVESTTM